MNKERREVTVDGELVKLTPTEYRILQLLMENPGIVFSSTQIYEKVWEDSFVTDNTSPKILSVSSDFAESKITGMLYFCRSFIIA